MNLLSMSARGKTSSIRLFLWHRTDITVNVSRIPSLFESWHLPNLSTQKTESSNWPSTSSFFDCCVRVPIRSYCSQVLARLAVCPKPPWKKLNHVAILGLRPVANLCVAQDLDELDEYVIVDRIRCRNEICNILVMQLRENIYTLKTKFEITDLDEFEKPLDWKWR